MWIDTLGAASLAVFGELGGAYLAVIGGTAALETTWVEAIEDVEIKTGNALSGECFTGELEKHARILERRHAGDYSCPS